jgi:hypothetical protein
VVMTLFPAVAELGHTVNDAYRDGTRLLSETPEWEAAHHAVQNVRDRLPSRRNAHLDTSEELFARICGVADGRCAAGLGIRRRTDRSEVEGVLRRSFRITCVMMKTHPCSTPLAGRVRAYATTSRSRRGWPDRCAM